MATYKAKPNVGNAVPYWVSDYIGRDNHQKIITGGSAELSNIPTQVLEFLEVTDSKPTSDNTVAEIKAYLDSNSISYTSDENKTSLLAKVGT